MSEGDSRKFPRDHQGDGRRRADGLSKNLRTLDSMQLAVMKGLGSQTITHIYCADRAFVALLEEEGFPVINPEEP
jgi:hypothetical protein